MSGLRGQRTERSEGRCRIESRREVVDKGFHGGVPEAVEAEEIHLFGCLFSGPLLDGHAIDGGENAGAVVAETAVQEDFLPGMVMEEREKLDDLFIGGRVPAADGNVDKAHAQRFGVLALPKYLFAVLAAQIDDGSDPQHFQLRETHFSGLRAAVEEIRNLPGVGNSGDTEFFTVSNSWEGRSGGRRRGLRRRLRKKGKWKKEREGECVERAFHMELDAKSVA